ncbi:MFS transporter [Rhizobium sp. CNPSo 4062]|uniref:MFS transporter n=1 Tax=Rhizobium sp. CNPSo 4062 TaxID=3021410 RepID=UPI00255025EE|nr:MFS transporter [Rhizobium sp. CNPSo 4062]MDK4706190.1 MFS transporter [Rhizobium sp. CNPSo 4062]
MNTASQTIRSTSTLSLISIVALTFFGYLAIGLPLAVLPTYVDSSLGFGVVWAGIAVSTQYVATIVSRAHVGRLCDQYGPRRSVFLGFLAYGLSGALTIASTFAIQVPAASLALLLAGRLALGIGESWVSTAAITWAIGLMGSRETVRIISWNGIATYGGIALAAPFGAWLQGQYGFFAIGVVTIILAVAGFMLAQTRPPVPGVKEKGIGTGQVLSRVAPYGIALALASSGFGVVMAFVALFFHSRGWEGASFALSAFGLAFMGVRLGLAQAVARFGGLPLVRISLVIEIIGLAALAFVPSPTVAIIGAALAGVGFAAVFPALGNEAMERIPPQNRGVALGLYSIFLDVSLGSTGPIAGLFADHFGYAAPFSFGVGAVLLSLILSFCLRRNSGR